MRKPPKPLEGYEQTKEKALRLLEFRNHAEKEIERKLAAAGASEENISKTIDFLREYHLVDDEQYAKSLAHDLQHIKGYGKNRIRSELSARGIARNIIDEVLENLEDTDTKRLCERIEKRLKGNFDKKNTDKVIRYFIYHYLMKF